MKKGFVTEKSYQKDGVIFAFHIDGMFEENIDIEAREILLDDCFRKLNSYSDIGKNIIWLRTILKELEESLLKIHIFERSKETHIEYKNKQFQSIVR